MDWVDKIKSQVLIGSFGSVLKIRTLSVSYRFKLSQFVVSGLETAFLLLLSEKTFHDFYLNCLMRIRLFPEAAHLQVSCWPSGTLLVCPFWLHPAQSLTAHPLAPSTFIKCSHMPWIPTVSPYTLPYFSKGNSNHSLTPVLFPF